MKALVVRIFNSTTGEERDEEINSDNAFDAWEVARSFLLEPGDKVTKILRDGKTALTVVDNLSMFWSAKQRSA
jgi:hypothetical protein